MENPVVVKAHLSAALSAVPDLGLSRFQFGNVVLIAALGAVDAAADLVDVRGGTADGSGQHLLLGVVHLDDIAVDQHLAGVSAEVVRPQLAHFVLHEIQLLLVEADFLADGVRSGMRLTPSSVARRHRFLPGFPDSRCR